MGNTSEMCNRGRIIKGGTMIEFLTKVIVILCVIAIMGVVLALPVMLLWNWVMPDIFNLPTIDFWHAF